MYNKDRERQDIEGGKTDETRTMELMVEIGDTLIKGIKLTYDLPELNDSGKCPVLDTVMWKETNTEGKATVRHGFYEKTMASPIVFHRRSAYSWRSKIVTLGEEVRRISFVHGRRGEIC